MNIKVADNKILRAVSLVEAIKHDWRTEIYNVDYYFINIVVI